MVTCLLVAFYEARIPYAPSTCIPNALRWLRAVVAKIDVSAPRISLSLGSDRETLNH